MKPRQANNERTQTGVSPCRGQASKPGTNEVLVREALRGAAKWPRQSATWERQNVDDEGFFNRMADMFRKGGAREVAHALIAGQRRPSPKQNISYSMRTSFMSAEGMWTRA